jgi:hypothetical protein
MHTPAVFIEELLGSVFDHFGESELNSRVWPKVSTGDVCKSETNFVEFVAAIVDDYPAHSNSGHQKTFGQAAAGQDGNILR